MENNHDGTLIEVLYALKASENAFVMERNTLAAEVCAAARIRLDALIEDVKDSEGWDGVATANAEDLIDIGEKFIQAITEKK